VLPRPQIFVSAVSRELKSARQLVANTLTFLGYEPVWQDIFGTEGGDLRQVLREQIHRCNGVIQLVGKCYGAEPPTPDQKFGRVSYTQYEALYAREQGKKVWYLFIDENFPVDPCDVQPKELRELQAAYRQRVQADTHVFHSLTSSEALEARVLKLRDDLSRLRRGLKQWQAGVALLLVVLVSLVLWELRKQESTERKLDEVLRQSINKYPDIERQVRREQPAPREEGRIRQKQPEERAAEIEERTYAELSKQLGIDQKLLREKLPKFAEELKHSPDATSYERANAAYVAKDYSEAERLALQAAREAQGAQPPRAADAIKAFLLAGRSANEGIKYTDALRHFQEAEKLTDRQRDPIEWASVQWSIAKVLDDEGKSEEAENLFRPAIAEYERVRGREDRETLSIQTDLAIALYDQGKFAEAEVEHRAVLRIREKTLAPNDPDTLTSRDNLAMALEDQGKYAEAEAEHRSVLQAREKVLGPGHPDTLTSRDNLAAAQEDEGKYAEAAEEFRAIVKIKEKTLGPEHPETLASRNYLGYTLHDLGKNVEAEVELRAVLKIQEKVLGPKHPDTLWTRNNLADALDGEGKYAEAESEYRLVLTTRETLFGSDHRYTLLSRMGLAVVRDDQGKHSAAESELRSILKIQEELLGEDDRDTLESCFHLVDSLKKQKKLREAQEFGQRAVASARKVLGVDHPETQKYEKVLRDLEAKEWLPDFCWKKRYRPLCSREHEARP